MGRKNRYDRPGRPTVNRAGQRFGPLTVLRLANKEPNNHCWKWLCRCVCGNLVKVRGAALKKRKVCSCKPRGNSPVPREFMPLNPRRKYPEPRMLEAKLWRAMIDRCHNSKSSGYRNYGGRGIVVCDRWRMSFDSFLEDMGRRPAVGHTIGRINNDGPYSPGNCRWETMREQANNTRRNHILRSNGKSQTISQWSRETGISPHCIIKRIEMGWSESDAVTILPAKKTLKRPPGSLVEIGGIARTIPQWANESRIPVKTIYARISKGWKIEDAVLRPLKGMAR